MRSKCTPIYFMPHYPVNGDYIPCTRTLLQLKKGDSREREVPDVHKGE